MRDRRENMMPPAMRRLMIVFFIVPLRCSLVIARREMICQKRGLKQKVMNKVDVVFSYSIFPSLGLRVEYNATMCGQRIRFFRVHNKLLDHRTLKHTI